MRRREFLLSLAGAAARGGTERFEARVWERLPYRLYRPVDVRGARPLILFLHGFEALGSDNRKQISGKDYAGSHAWTSRDCFVVAPQCPLGRAWASVVTRRPSRHLRRVVNLLDALAGELPVDPDRVYVTGQSLGGFGTWALIGEYPERFAAAAPVCGGGRVRDAKAMAGIPVWAFHGALDPIVLPRESRRMVSALQRAGGQPIYTEFPMVLHNAWDLAYANPLLIEWMLAQRRGVKVVV